MACLTRSFGERCLESRNPPPHDRTSRSSPLRLHMDLALGNPRAGDRMRLFNGSGKEGSKTSTPSLYLSDRRVRSHLPESAPIRRAQEVPQGRTRTCRVHELGSALRVNVRGIDGGKSI